MSYKQESTKMSFLDHLEELRWRVLKSVIAVVVCAVPSAFFWKDIFDLVMIHPLRLSSIPPKLIYTQPAEAVILSLKIAVAGGIIFSAPVIFYQLWAFISPGLYKKEKVVILPTVFASTIFFLGGIGFSYIVMPYVIQFLVNFGADKLEALYRAQEYLGFLIKFSLAFGIVFELPVISFVLSHLGIITPLFLIRNIRYAIVAAFVLSAILTPPDPLSQMMLALPLMVLYLLSIIVSYVVVRRKA